MRFVIISCLMLLSTLLSRANDKNFCLNAGSPVKVAYEMTEGQNVKTAIELLKRDCMAVFSDSLVRVQQNSDIIIGTVGVNAMVNQPGVDISKLEGKKQAFLLAVSSEGKLVIAGSDKYGTAYGIMELSRLIGVSPWEWWADVTPAKKEKFELPSEFSTLQAPSVEYRGIFINDEDWGLMQWSSWNYEPWYMPGRIGARTNERIFELMLRLRANTYWPAMHECTVPFFLVEGNREVAEKFGIFIGGSHCEPMASSTAGEWPRRGKGDYDYVNNSSAVYKFWEDRVKKVANQEILYTIGMRGVHDGKMQGAETIAEQKAVLERVFKDQRHLLQQYVNKDVTSVPQVFIPYKEVLDIYNSGLEVPEDVALMWCDDNYGYIRHFPTDEERARKGGNGMYYHVSYWGRPHDYLWLGTFSPFLLYQQMKQAYDHGVQKIWILNVGDIKPAEYQIELFMDMAWNIDQVTDKGVSKHLCNFLKREFGQDLGNRLSPVMEEYYRLAYIRKPEFMGNTRVEENEHSYQIVKDLPWSKSYINKRLADYKVISDEVEKALPLIPKNRMDAYVQLVKYPVQGATEMNKKMLYAQYARHGEMDWRRSDAAYDSIVSLTRVYNVGIYNKGKWHRIMDYQPRRLPVFEPVDRDHVDAPMLSEERQSLYKWNGADATKGIYKACEGLGYEGKAVELEKNKELIFEFGKCPTDSIEVEIKLLPNHPVSGNQLRFSVSMDGKGTQTINYETKGRSEEWKENVLRNQAIRLIRLPLKKNKPHRLILKAMDEGVILDQIRLYSY